MARSCNQKALVILPVHLQLLPKSHLDETTARAVHGKATAKQRKDQREGVTQKRVVPGLSPITVTWSVHKNKHFRNTTINCHNDTLTWTSCDKVLATLETSDRCRNQVYLVVFLSAEQGTTQLVLRMSERLVICWLTATNHTSSTDRDAANEERVVREV